MLQKSRKHIGVLTLIVLVLSLAVLACASEVSPTQVGQVSTQVPTNYPTEDSMGSILTESPTEQPQTSPLTTYQVGDIISLGDVVIVVLGWSMPPGNEFLQPDAGNVFVAVDVTLVNQSDSAIFVSSALQMALKDSTDQQYNPDFSASVAIGGPGLDGEISPGERMRGQVGFQVPQDATGLVFVFDTGVWEMGKVFVELGPEPVALEPPAELPGERPLTAYAVGDMIEIGDLTITVNSVSNPPNISFSEPDEGNKFLVIDLAITNRSTGAIIVSSMLQMFVRDATGRYYDLDLMASVSGRAMPEGEFAPGETIRGQVCFQVPEDAVNLMFVFDAGVWDYGKVFVALPQ